MKISIITGVYGQDGSLLAEFLVSKGHHVIGLVKKIRPNFIGLEKVEIIEMDILNRDALEDLFLSRQPDECYHLAAIHHSSEIETSLDIRLEMFKINFFVTELIIEIIINNSPKCRLLFAGSSQMYSASHETLIVDEKTSFCPSTYYGITKVAGSQLLNLMRSKKELWGTTAILFNHESSRRGQYFLSRKITTYVADIHKSNIINNSFSINKKLKIKDLSALIDWSASEDIVRALYLILQSDTPSDYVLGSGILHSVEDFLNEAFNSVNLNWKDYVEVENLENKSKPSLKANTSLANSKLGWISQITFSEFIKNMVQSDIKSQ
jgi:GDPmannose 4,6-dehydratase